MTDETHIFPFCRQSYDAGLKDGVGGMRAWNAALEEALKVIAEVEAIPAGSTGRDINTVRTEIHARMIKIETEPTP